MFTRGYPKRGGDVLKKSMKTISFVICSLSSLGIISIRNYEETCASSLGYYPNY